MGPMQEAGILVVCCTDTDDLDRLSLPCYTKSVEDVVAKCRMDRTYVLSIGIQYYSHAIRGAAYHVSNVSTFSKVQPESEPIGQLDELLSIFTTDDSVKSTLNIKVILELPGSWHGKRYRHTKMLLVVRGDTTVFSSTSALEVLETSSEMQWIIKICNHSMYGINLEVPLVRLGWGGLVTVYAHDSAV
ncbi:uncharacterized protein C8R40DRAFT_1065618 [Lentinula edodes]|uniref:uncharacterized protein n=1 Tax=Lentinula edodes TaxID=5353 RepID=UPI001E8E0C19|nr:uncharacterized protein C8R40DRAFT_1065618 [Lentinula edodes]KAH7880614.1 hypothetical protein C8R40DRAFT_1065618 [Lentinula edodes]